MYKKTAVFSGPWTKGNSNNVAPSFCHLGGDEVGAEGGGAQPDGVSPVGDHPLQLLVAQSRHCVLPPKREEEEEVNKN